MPARLERLAQAADVNVDGALLDEHVVAPDQVEERTVDVHIRRLRKALEPSGHDRLIDTVRGSGYGFRTG